MIEMAHRLLDYEKNVQPATVYQEQTLKGISLSNCIPRKREDRGSAQFVAYNMLFLQ